MKVRQRMDGVLDLEIWGVWKEGEGFSVVEGTNTSILLIHGPENQPDEVHHALLLM